MDGIGLSQSGAIPAHSVLYLFFFGSRYYNISSFLVVFICTLSVIKLLFGTIISSSLSLSLFSFFFFFFPFLQLPTCMF